MKFPSTLLATIALSLTASAAPLLVVETTITENGANGAGKKFAAQHIAVESGKQAVIQIGKLQFAMVPALIDGDNVSVPLIITKSNGNTAEQLGEPIIATKLGETASIQIGGLVFTIKTSLAK